MTETSAMSAARRRTALVAVAVLAVVTIGFLLRGVASATSYRSEAVLNVTLARDTPAPADTLQGLMPAVAASVTADAARSRAAAAASTDTDDDWSVSARTEPGTGLLTIGVEATTRGSAQRLAAAYVAVATDAVATFQTGAVARTVDPATPATSQRWRAVGANLALGLGLGAVLALLVLLAGSWLPAVRGEGPGARGSRHGGTGVPEERRVTTLPAGETVRVE